MPSAPACINEFPFAVIDLDGVPSVSAVFDWNWLARLEGREASAFAMAANDKGFEAGFRCDGGEEASVAFADGKACAEGVGGSGGFDSIVAEGDDIVGDIVMEPGEDSTGLVGRRCEGTDKLAC